MLTFGYKHFIPRLLQVNAHYFNQLFQGEICIAKNEKFIRTDNKIPLRLFLNIP